MPDQPLRLLILGAHPDDAEYHAGGLASIYRQLGHTVRMVSVTNGSAGHHEKPREAMAVIRRGEAAASGRVIDTLYEVWDWPDGELVASLEVRNRIIAAIRSFGPDLVLTHRTSDYHPDHRALGQAVQDASFLVTVPHVVPEVPALRKDPVVGQMVDLFTRPVPIQPDIVLDVTDRVDTIVAMIGCHRSQVFEWLPWLEGTFDQVPAGDTQRRVWLRDWFLRQVRPRVERFRKELIAAYGEEQASRAECVEVFEISQYAAPLDAAARRRLFPFAPAIA